MGLFIVSTIDSLHPIRGGGALRVLKVAQTFQRMGHQVIIFAPSTKMQLKGMKVYPLPYPTERRFQILSVATFNLRMLLTMIRFIFRADLFFVHNTTAAISIFLLTRIFRKRFVLDVTDLHTEYLLARGRSFWEKILTPYLVFVDYLIIKSADSVIAVTENMRDYLIKRGVNAKKIRVVYDGAEVGQFLSEKGEAALFNIIHLGTMDRQHGVEILVRAIPYVIEKYPQARFYFVGGGRKLGKIRELARMLTMDSYCIFTGPLPYPEVKKYLSKAGIGIIPRLDNLANNQVVTVKLFEYWASATAVISARLKGIAEVAREGHDIIFFQPGNPQDLAGKIIYLLDRPGKWKGLQRKGRESVRRFSWLDLSAQIRRIAIGGR